MKQEEEQEQEQDFKDVEARAAWAHAEKYFTRYFVVG